MLLSCSIRLAHQLQTSFYKAKTYLCEQRATLIEYLR
jgi:hypothetical protein